MISIGATVRWRHKIDKRATVIGVVTGHPQPRMVEVDGKGWISEGLLEVVGEMTDETEEALNDKIDELMDERDALRELVVSQATVNAQLAQEITDGDNDRIAELEEWVGNAQSYVEDLLLLFMGERRPVRPIEPPELRRLAEFMFEGV